MTAKTMKKRHHKPATLFGRITVRLTLPLLFLAMVFTGIQLTNQMSIMNHSYQTESRLTFDSIQKILNDWVKDKKNLADLNNLKKELITIASTYRVSSIHIYDLFNRSNLFADEAVSWNITDFQSMEKSLRQKQLGKPYYVHVDKERRSVIAYTPFEGLTENDLWIARVMFPLPGIKEAMITSRWTLGIMIFLILMTGFVIGAGLAKSIVDPIRSLNEATQEIMKGHLGKQVLIATGDEIETLADTFNHMSESLKVMKQRAEDANPLTQLPGNQGIFYELNKRIQQRQKFVLYHADLDRFKIFNDSYGLARGDEVIKKTAQLLREAVREKGSPDDFIGHQGGDDFVLIVKPTHAVGIAEHVIQRFDKEIVRSLYRKEDYERGHILAPDRRRSQERGEAEGEPVKFPLMAISLAGISNVKKDFADYYDCLSRAVPVKKEVKRALQSSYIIQE